MKTKNVVKGLDYYAKLPYTIVIERRDDAEKPYWVARVAELPHCLIHGDTPEEAAREIEQVKLDWIKSNLEDRLPIPEPSPRKYSGEIRLRMPPSLHQHVARMASIEDISLNQYMVTAIARCTGYDEAKKRKVKAR